MGNPATAAPDDKGGGSNSGRHRHHHHGHHHRHHHHLCGSGNGESNDKSLPETTPRFRNVKPRVGSQYQTKIPKQLTNNNTASNSSFLRPSPLLMSKEFPHLTRQEAETIGGSGSSRMDDVDAGYGPIMQAVKQQPVPSPMTVTTPRMQLSLSFRRNGGLLVHRPIKDKEEKATAAVHMSTSAYVHSLHSGLPTEQEVQAWACKLIGGGNSSTASSTTGSSRRRAKRKYASLTTSNNNNNSMETTSFTTTAAVSNTTLPAAAPSHSNVTQRQPLLSAADELQLEFLAVKHGTNVETAQLALQVASGAGRAHRARRALKRRDHLERFRRPLVTSSASWKERLERECPSIVFLHYSQDRDDALFAMMDNDNACQSSSMCISFPPEDMKRVWKAVLALAQEMEKELNNCSKMLSPPQQQQPQRLLLSHVIGLVKNAYCLPLPEDSYGTRHIVVEGISEAMHSILQHVTSAHDAQAKLLDVLHDENGVGVDIASVRKLMDECESTLVIRLDVLNVLEEQVDLALQWQRKLDGLVRDGALVADGVDDLAAAEELLCEAGTFGICWRGQVELEQRAQKAYQLRDRLRQWQTSCVEQKKESFKFVAALVRDANRLNMNFPEVSELLAFHQAADAWVERANVALRSRISLTEIESLIDRAENMPLDLSEYTNKLQNRIRLSQSWISEFQDFVPAPFQDGKVDNLAWMSRMRQALQTTEKRVLMKLQDIATEGTRIPVEIDCVKLLLVEIDAKTWSRKAVKWIPSKDDASNDGDVANGGKRAKLVDIRDHLDKAEALRENLVLPPEEREAWPLEGEPELKSIIEDADDWYDKYHEYLEYDNRRNRGDRSCLSIATLRQIVNEGNLIHAQIGSASGKMSRILGQAETWYEEFGSLLCRCGIRASIAPALPTRASTNFVTLEEVRAAVDSAEANISLDLDEARALRDLGERIEKWQDRVVMAAPKRSKRVGKGKHQEARYTVDDLVSLIDESTGLPIKTEEDAERLRQQLCKVHEWRIKARREFREIDNQFRLLRQAVNADYGLPDELRDENRDEEDECMKTSEKNDSLSSVSSDVTTLGQNVLLSAFSGDVNETQSAKERCSATQSDKVTSDAPESAEDSSQADTSSVADSDLGANADMVGGGSGVFKMVSSLLKSLKHTGIRTPEEEVAELLEKSSRWLARSLKCVDSPKDVYERKSFGPFDEFLESGEELLVLRDSFEAKDLEDSDYLPSLGSALADLVSDQISRLKVLQAHRDQYIIWYRHVQHVLSSKENRVTLDVLREMAEQSHEYPANSDMVQKVRQAAQRASKFKQAASTLIDSEEKPTIQEARALVDQGDKLNLSCDELKALRSAVRSAQAWSSRVRRAKIDQGGANSNTVTKLLNDHESLLLSMPSEYAKLNQALRGYCLCRQPYDGFMIGCNSCDEWYHGPCVGVTESRARKTDKFICLRCSLKRIFTSSASTVASIIKKWTDPDELRKVRQHEVQKHQRKVRKEKNDIDCLAAETRSMAALLNELKEALPCAPSSQTDGQGTQLKGVSVSPSSFDGENNDSIASEAAPRSDQSEVFGSMADGLKPSDVGTNSKDSSGSVANARDDVARAPASSLDETASSLTQRKHEIEHELSKAVEAVKASGDRLASFTAIANERKIQETLEDGKKSELRRWCIRVRSLVLVPSTKERAAASLPPSDGSLSLPMLEVLNDAMVLNIRDLAVVAEVENAFKCVAWCCFAMPLVARRPSLSEIDSIVSMGAHLKLPEEKPMRMMKSITQRAKTWQSKVVRALAPRPHVADPVSVDTLKGLVKAAAGIPVSIPGEACVQNVLDDKGTRYCICGGPHFGSFMLGCDRCERWYHGRCVGVNSEEGEALSSWVCPPCMGLSDIETRVFSVQDFDYTDDEAGDDLSDSEDDKAIDAPVPQELWPPFGLSRSPQALDALGEKCCAIEDDVREIGVTSFSLVKTGVPAVCNPLYAANGVNFLNRHGSGLFNSYTFGGAASAALSNAATAVKPVFTNGSTHHAPAQRAAAIASLTNPHCFGGLVSSDINKKEISEAHGFNGIVATETIAHGSFIVKGCETAASHEAELNITHASAELLGTSSLTSLDKDDRSTNLDTTISSNNNTKPVYEQCERPPLPSMNWQPPIMQATSTDSNGVAHDSTSKAVGLTVTPNGAPTHSEQKMEPEPSVAFAAAGTAVVSDRTATSARLSRATDPRSTSEQGRETLVEETEQDPRHKLSTDSEGQPRDALAQEMELDEPVQSSLIAHDESVSEASAQSMEQHGQVHAPETPKAGDALRFETMPVQESVKDDAAQQQERAKFETSTHAAMLEQASIPNMSMAASSHHQDESALLEIPIQEESLDVRAS